MKEAYIIAGFRSAVGKAPRGTLKNVRPDDLAVSVIKHLLQSVPELDPNDIDDVIVGNATPEAEQGLNIGRMISLMGLNTEKVPGMTVNRYCASGLETIAIAHSKIVSGQADCIIAGGVECMSPIPFGGWRITPNPKVALENPDYYWGMGLTAEAVANEYKVSRSDQDEFSYHSHQKAIKAIDQGYFTSQIVPYTFKEVFLNEKNKRSEKEIQFSIDEGPRADTSVEKLNTLKPVFSAQGSITAGNSSQTSDGAAFVLLVSDTFAKKLKNKPLAKMLSYGVAGVSPRIMGIGPVEAIPKALKKANLKLSDIQLVELNEAFASQSIAVIRETGLNPDMVNVNGGAIALGHPLGCSGAKLSVQLFNELTRRNLKYGMVTMCVGTGQGAAGVFEMF
ncbi:MAG TPA: acetyl-CoA C-acyltransferase [Bacteroidia bacterium]|nr:acetyl-CoA C-acyltransferase [Bacteroidia bacterium]HNT79186.1 acetyl-CoA C-acyltransferase [Bacteroidia bacterium]